ITSGTRAVPGRSRGRSAAGARPGVAITLAEPREHRLLGQLGAAAKQKIEVLSLPTVADLRARRLEMLRVELREAVEAGGCEPFREVVESLAGELDVLDVAAAAAKLVHDAAGVRSGDEEIPAPALPGGAPKPRRRQDWKWRGPRSPPGARRASDLA